MEIFTSLLSQIIINPPKINTCGLRQDSGPTETSAKRENLFTIRENYNKFITSIENILAPLDLQSGELIYKIQL